VRDCCDGDLTTMVLPASSLALVCCCRRGGGGGGDDRGDDRSSSNDCSEHLLVFPCDGNDEAV